MLTLNRNVFFSRVRHGPFPGRLTQNQVSGMNDLLDEWEENGTDDPRHLAYVFATDFHETGAKMQPVREGFKTTDAAARKYVARRKYGKPEGPWGHVYFGMGDVQLTWYDNFVRMGKILNLPLAEFPHMVLDPKVSKRILVEGMTNGVSKDGDFTGKALEDYFNETTDDPTQARRIVNGTDKAFLIASYHDEFLEAVEAALKGIGGEDDTLPVTLPVTLPAANDQTSWGGVVAVLAGLTGTALSLTEKLSGPAVLIVVGLIAVGGVLIVRGRRNLLKETGE